MRDLIKKVLLEKISRTHGDSIPDKWIDGNTRSFLETGGVKYRVIFPWNRESNGDIQMQVLPYDKEDRAWHQEIEDAGYSDKYSRDNRNILWGEEPGNKVFNALSSYLGRDHKWSVYKREHDERGFTIYASMNVFELVEDFLNIIDDGFPI